MISKLLIKRLGFTPVGTRCIMKLFPALIVTILLHRFPFKLIINYQSPNPFKKIVNLRDLLYNLSVRQCQFKSYDGFIFEGYDPTLFTVAGFKMEKINFSIINKLLDKNSIFIDVGGHIGGYTIRVSRLSKLVIAFEPDPRNYYYLLKNIKLNGIDNVIPLFVAAYKNSGEVLKLYLSRKTDTSTLLISHGKTTAINVRTLTLDDAVNKLGLDRVDMIKIDTEGAEYDILLGAKQILSMYKPFLLVEVHSKENYKKVRKFLSEHNYSISIRLGPMDVIAKLGWYGWIFAYPMTDAS